MIKFLDLAKVNNRFRDEIDTRIANILDKGWYLQGEENEVLLKVKACGICSSDYARIFKTGTYHFPTIPGHEFCGEIVNVGENVSQDLLYKGAKEFTTLCH